MRDGSGRSERSRADRRRRRWVVALVAFFVVGALLVWWAMVRMPGASYALGLDPLTDDERGIADAMRRDVVKLAEEIGERNVAHPRGLAAAADFIASSFGAAGLATKRAAFVTSGVTCENVAGEIAGGASKDDIVVIGAHYDSVEGTVGANDNASGVAALLSLARALATSKPARTLRFVAFANEEPPWFQTPNMGSLVYARACRERGDRIVAMLSLETIGYYSSVSGSQRYPFPLSLVYPSTGDFIAFVGDLGSRALVREAIDVFRQTTHFPSEGGALPGWIPGIGWSDHWSFWQAGYPAIMVTDTAPFRYPHYHTTRDTPDQLDYERTARVVRGLERVVAALARC